MYDFSYEATKLSLLVICRVLYLFLTFPLSLYSCLSLPLSISLSPFLPYSLSLSFTLPVSNSLSLSLSLFQSLSPHSLSLSPTFSHSLCLFLSLSPLFSEPGYYEANNFGIRIENLMIVVPRPDMGEFAGRGTYVHVT